jgi:hypothetical protein
MRIKGLNEYDVVNYKKPSMFVIMPSCSFKCDRECGRAVCQNSALASAKEIEIGNMELVNRYINNPLTKAIVFGGLEPLDSWPDLIDFLGLLRYVNNDEVVIYTGYKEEEIRKQLKILHDYAPVIVKLGRFMPNCESHFDEILGVDLASPNQYAIRIEN